VPGAGLLAVGFALLTVVLSFSPEWGWASARLLTCLAVGTVALVGAALVERRAPRPIVDLALFREPPHPGPLSLRGREDRMWS